CPVVVSAVIIRAVVVAAVVITMVVAEVVTEVVTVVVAELSASAVAAMVVGVVVIVIPLSRRTPRTGRGARGRGAARRRCSSAGLGPQPGQVAALRGQLAPCRLHPVAHLV